MKNRCVSCGSFVREISEASEHKKKCKLVQEWKKVSSLQAVSESKIEGNA